MKETEIKKAVRERYGKIASQGKAVGSTSVAGCCSPQQSAESTQGAAPQSTRAASCCRPQDNLSKVIDYSDEELKVIPEGANLGLGCGNPTALASLKAGEVVLDLGSGGGIDCFLAANAVGQSGRIIGVDMTPEMLQLARDNAEKMQVTNVEFRLGEIENLPVADNSVDVIISNCVINLAPDKRRVFKEAYRVLKSGGRLLISDMVLLNELPDLVKTSVEAYVGCLAGAVSKEEYLGAIEAAGFQEVSVIAETVFPVELMANDPTVKEIIDSLGIPPEIVSELTRSAASIKVYGVKAD